MHEPETKRK